MIHARVLDQDPLANQPIACRTIRGVVSATDGGSLCGLIRALSQLAREGSPFIRAGAGGSQLDMRTMVSSYAAPDGGPYGWALAHYYDLPIFGTAGVSDA